MTSSFEERAPLRSWLFTPANHPRRVAKALSLDVDVVLIDLEDACPEAEKDAARGAVRDALEGPRRGKGYVRVNALSTGRTEGDLDALVGYGLDGVMLPKIERADDLRIVDDMIAELERVRALPQGAIDLVPLIETGLAVADVRSIVHGCKRVRRFAFGSGDFCLDMGLFPGPDEIELLPFRAALALAARAEGLEPPIDCAWLNVDDKAGMERSAQRTRNLGFQGKLCIHPDQAPVVHAAFSPSTAEVAHASRIVAGFEAAEARGDGAIKVDGELVDYPIYYKAQRLLAAAARAARG